MNSETFVQYVSKFTKDFNYPVLEPCDVVILAGSGTANDPFEAKVHTNVTLVGFETNTFILRTPIFTYYLVYVADSFKYVSKIRVNHSKV